MINKRGQITIFIILGIVIVISVGLFLTINKIEFKPVTYDTKVKDYVTNCLKQVSDEGIYLIGKQGGVLYDDQINHPQDHFQYSFQYKIPKVLV